MHALHEAKFHYPSVRTQTFGCRAGATLKRLYKTGRMETMTLLSTMGRSIPSRWRALPPKYSRRPHDRSRYPSRDAKGYMADNVPNTLMRAIRDMFKRYRGRFARPDSGRKPANWAAMHSLVQVN